VLLREIVKEDIASVEEWFAEAAAAARGGGGGDVRGLAQRVSEASESTERGLLGIARVRDRELVGLLEYRAGEPTTGWLTIGGIALRAGERGWGLGSEALRLLEEEATRLGLGRNFLAKVDIRNGLGLYFWLRAGYRPAGRQEDGWPADERQDMIRMVREANPA